MPVRPVTAWQPRLPVSWRLRSFHLPMSSSPAKVSARRAEATASHGVYHNSGEKAKIFQRGGVERNRSGSGPLGSGGSTEPFRVRPARFRREYGAVAFAGLSRDGQSPSPGLAEK